MDPRPPAPAEARGEALAAAVGDAGSMGYVRRSDMRGVGRVDAAAGAYRRHARARQRPVGGRCGLA